MIAPLQIAVVISAIFALSFLFFIAFSFSRYFISMQQFSPSIYLEIVISFYITSNNCDLTMRIFC